MKYFMILLLLLTLCGCGETRGQVYKIVSPDEMQTMQFYCTTVLKVPVLCGIRVHTEKTIRIEEIVIEVRNRIVEIEKIVEVPVDKIVKEVYTIYRDKDVDLEAIISEVIRRVEDSVAADDLMEVDFPILVEEVSQAVIESTPYTETSVEHVVSMPVEVEEMMPVEVEEMPKKISVDGGNSANLDGNVNLIIQTGEHDAFLCEGTHLKTTAYENGRVRGHQHWDACQVGNNIVVFLKDHPALTCDVGPNTHELEIEGLNERVIVVEDCEN